MSAPPGRPLSRRNPPRRDTSWMADAACKGLPSELFFPSRGQRIHPLIKQICGDCPVRVECLHHALMIDADGVWGGIGEYERRGIARQIRRFTR